jgi:hypothetical protein
MSNEKELVVEDLDSLLELIQQCEFWVEWYVKCEVGPDWLGGGRSITFYLDNSPLAETRIHSQLKNALVVALQIPDKSIDAVIYGEGEITREESTLVVNFEWDEAVPFQYSRDSGTGKVQLVDLSSPFQ